MTPQIREEGWRERLKRAASADSLGGFANALLGDFAARHSDYFLDLEDDLRKANIRVLFRTYLAGMLLATIVGAFTGLLIAVLVIVITGPPIVLSLVMLAGLPFLFGLMAFAMLYFYPSQKAGSRASNIDRNLPFALNHMSAVAGSGVPPSSMFELLVNFEEYGEIAEEAEEIVTRVRAFGEDVTTAIRDVARDSPSDDMREVFYGMVATIDTGGDLRDFLEERSQRALFDYRMQREKDIERLTTFASFYTALLVAAPLFLVVILAVLQLVGGQLFGLPIKSSCGIVGALLGECPIGVIDIGAYILIPVANTLFLIVLEVMVPEF